MVRIVRNINYSVPNSPLGNMPTLAHLNPCELSHTEITVALFRTYFPSVFSSHFSPFSLTCYCVLLPVNLANRYCSSWPLWPRRLSHITAPSPVGSSAQAASVRNLVHHLLSSPQVKINKVVTKECLLCLAENLLSSETLVSYYPNVRSLRNLCSEHR